MREEGLTGRIIRKRVLFYVLVALYTIGLLAGGTVCRVSALLVSLIPFTLTLLIIADSIMGRDYVTALSGLLLIVLVLAAKLGLI